MKFRDLSFDCTIKVKLNFHLSTRKFCLIRRFTPSLLPRFRFSFKLDQPFSVDPFKAAGLCFLRIERTFRIEVSKWCVLSLTFYNLNGTIYSKLFRTLLASYNSFDRDLEKNSAHVFTILL